MSRLAGVTPFPPEFAARYRERGYWEDVPLGRFYAGVFASHGDRVAMVSGEERVTYSELNERVDHLARHLLEMGVVPLDRWVVQLPNIPEFVYLYFALERLGAIPIMALPGHRWNEINAFFELSGATGYAVDEMLGDFDSLPLIAQVRDAHPGVHTVLGAKTIRELLRSKPALDSRLVDAVEVDPDEPCILQLSGGTTGVPKLIPRTNNDYVYNTKAAVAVNEVHADDCLLVALPIAHNFPLACPGISGFFWKGARVVLTESPRADDILPLIESERTTHLELVPALLIRYINSPGVTERDLSSVRVINTGGQKLQPEVKRRAEIVFPNARVQEVFGMAEGLLMFVRLDDSEEARYETAGRPVCDDDEILIVDEDRNPVPDGEVGELLVRGPYTLRGYYNVPEYNARAFTPDGFYCSGDLMRRHPSGNYIVEGRKKDLINRGGEKISAEEIENLILSHPAVLNVACVPMPDPVLGERMCAFVIPKPGRTLTLSELTGFLTEKGLAKFKLPERLELTDDLPLSKFGKVAKNVLTKQVAEKIQAPTT
ncbi:MAG: (2,3-dihydroxybenzoyl)adenylate synthase [Chloroflexi bacterium]|nr:MAG: (2,3-dihydroxybenzoyl)adenylate synthase [Chloroflexota bacterium]